MTARLCVENLNLSKDDRDCCVVNRHFGKDGRGCVSKIAISAKEWPPLFADKHAISVRKPRRKEPATRSACLRTLVAAVSAGNVWGEEVF